MKELLNEMDRMKNLFGYKRGVVISEQPDEKFDTRANKEITRELNKPTQQQETESFPECVRKFGNPYKSKGNLNIIAGTENFKGFYFFSNGRVRKSDNTMGNYECYNGNILIDGVLSNGVEGDNFANFPCLSTFKIEKMATDTEVGVQFKVGSGNFANYIFGADGTLYNRNQLKTGTWKCGSTPNTININGKDYSVGVEGGQTIRKNQQISIPKELGNVDGVKLFQDWLDLNHPGWIKKYNTLNSRIERGYGKFGPNTQNAWKNFGKEYLNSIETRKKTVTDTTPAEKLPYAGTQQATTQVAPEIKAPEQVANYQGQQQAFANVNPNEYYKTLYNSGLIQGEGGNRVRYRGPELNKEQQDKLTQAMSNLGYDFYRKGTDNRLVYKKK